MRRKRRKTGRWRATTKQYFEILLKHVAELVGGPLWGLGGALGAIRGPLGLQGLSLRLLGTRSGAWGSSWSSPLWSSLRPFSEPSRRRFWQSEVSLGPSWALWGRLEALLDCLGPFRGVSGFFSGLSSVRQSGSGQIIDNQ